MGIEYVYFDHVNFLHTRIGDCIYWIVIIYLLQTFSLYYNGVNIIITLIIIFVQHEL